MTNAQGSPEDDGKPATRPRGRPRREIDLSAVADAVAELFAEGGMDAVTIGSTAEKVSISRATLYRTVPTKEHLLGVLFERSTRELSDAVAEVRATYDDPREQVRQLIQLQVDAAIRMRRYMPVFFGGAGLPPDVFARWHSWSRGFEATWTDTIGTAMDAGVLERADPVLTARLMLGMCIWVSRWYRSADGYDGEQIAEAAIRLLGVESVGAPTP